MGKKWMKEKNNKFMEAGTTTFGRPIRIEF